MWYETTARFDRSFAKLPKHVRLVFRKQIDLLMSDIRHPSLRAKKYDEGRGIWQARVTGNVRLYFSIVGSAYRLLDITKHKD